VVELFPDVSRLSPAQLQQRLLASTTQQQQQTQPTTQQQQQSQNGASTATDEPDQEDVEARLLQVMLDEFGVNVDDDSAYEVAEQVVRLRGECLRGRLDGVEALRQRWASRGSSRVVFKQGEDEDGETDWDTDDDDGEEEEDEEGEEDGDVEMGEAPAPRREKAEPEVDEDGFTKVTRKKR
jgi:pre-rRNA-processing protein TSR2